MLHRGSREAQWIINKLADIADRNGFNVAHSLFNIHAPTWQKPGEQKTPIQLPLTLLMLEALNVNLQLGSLDVKSGSRLSHCINYESICINLPRA